MNSIQYTENKSNHDLSTTDQLVVNYLSLGKTPHPITTGHR